MKHVLIFILNGEDVICPVTPGMSLGHARNAALVSSGNTGRPPDEWEIFDTKGQLLDPLATAVCFASETRFCCSLKVGAGGATTRCVLCRGDRMLRDQNPCPACLGTGVEADPVAPERWLQIRCANEGAGKHSAYNVRYPIGLSMFEKLNALFECEHCGAAMMALPDAEQ